MPQITQSVGRAPDSTADGTTSPLRYLREYRSGAHAGTSLPCQPPQPTIRAGATSPENRCHEPGNRMTADRPTVHGTAGAGTPATGWPA